MKTPDEIKKGLGFCPEGVCDDCPYEPLGNCMDDCMIDALAYIQQLEADLQREKDQHQYTIDAANVMKDEALKFESRLAQAEREREAAVEDARLGTACDTCFYNENPSLLHKPCDYCAGGFPMWQWRGVWPENTKEE